MSQTTPAARPAGETPLAPVYPFNSPSAPICLYDGPIGGFAATPWSGTVELDCLAGRGLTWRIEHEDYACLNLEGPASLRLKRYGIEQIVEGQRGAYTFTTGAGAVSTGWINTAVLGRPDASLDRVLVHWLNLPQITGSVPLVESNEAGEHSRLGRWCTDVDGWRLKLDIRPDYSDAMAAADTGRLYVITHVMEIRRADGGSFDTASAEGLIECLRLSFSFAFGRWVAPALPVGFDVADEIVWEQWTSPICDAAKSIGHAWLYKSRTDDLAELLRCTVPNFVAQGEGGLTRFQMILAVQAVESGFVEQRILAAAPALESLTWANLVLAKGITKTSFERMIAEDKLRLLLREANISSEIDATHLPALARLARSENIDGPTAVTRVRNRLVHPTDPQGQIYRHDGLVRDAWLLGLNYTTLLILHSIGYKGSYGDLTHLTRGAGEASSVPWAIGSN